MAVQWCTFVQFTKNHVQSENLHLRLDILHRLVFFSRTHPPSWGVFHGSESTRIKIHPSTAASVNEFFFSFRNSFFRGQKIASGAKKHWNAGFLTVWQRMTWSFRAKYLQDFLIRHALSGWQNGTCGWNESGQNPTLLLVAQMSYNNPQYIL